MTRTPAGAPRLEIVLITLRDAQDFVRRHHRHHRPGPGHKFSVGVRVLGHTDLVGVAITGRPNAVSYNDSRTLEVLRTCTDGTPNANSALLAASWRTAKALGALRAITYTQEGETGASLRAAGWRLIATRPPRGGWDSPSRHRTDTHPTGVARYLWLIGHDLPGRHESTADCHGTGHATHCRTCGTPLHQQHHGRPRTTCSDSCRTRLARRRNQQAGTRRTRAVAA